MRSATAHLAGKMGLTFEDHHYKNQATNRVERSPPREQRAMYDYLPTAYADESLWVTPTKITISGEISALKTQTHCLGVYIKIEGREAHGRPMWKHATADLVLAAARVDDEPGWVVSRWTTFGVKEQRCLQVAGQAQIQRNGHAVMVPISEGNKEEPQALPNMLKDPVWRAWAGNDWVEIPSVKCRASYHGWGLDRGDVSVHNAFSCAEEVVRRGQSPARSRGRSKSPPLPRPRKV